VRLQLFYFNNIHFSNHWYDIRMHRDTRITSVLSTAVNMYFVSYVGRFVTNSNSPSLSINYGFCEK